LQARRQKKTVVDVLKIVYHNVRFPLMTTKFFSANVVTFGMLTEKEMLDIFCYLSFPEGKSETKPFSTVPRTL